MKNLIFSTLICFLLIITISAKREFYSVYPDFSDKQIKKTEARILKELQIKVQIEVVERNADNQIINLICYRFDNNGTLKGKCQSDKFGELKITKTGCSISDL